jgi:hypothetical protein
MNVPNAPEIQDSSTQQWAVGLGLGLLLLLLLLLCWDSNGGLSN